MAYGPIRETKDTDADGALLWSFGKTARKLGGVSTRTVLRLVDDGELVSVYVGRRRMITAASAFALIQRQLKSNEG